MDADHDMIHLDKFVFNVLKELIDCHKNLKVLIDILSYTLARLHNA